jgi:hypothetical protein
MGMIIIIEMEAISACEYCGNFNLKGEHCECTPQEEDFYDFDEACEKFLKKS